MASDLRNGTETTSFTGLVSGILHDVQELMKQEVALAKAEFREELCKLKQAAVSMISGVALLALGAIFILLMTVHLIHWATSGNVPLWGCFAIVGGSLAGAGAGLLYCGRERAEQIHFVPRQTVDTLKENIQWIKNPR